MQNTYFCAFPIFRDSYFLLDFVDTEKLIVYETNFGGVQLQEPEHYKPQPTKFLKTYNEKISEALTMLHSFGHLAILLEQRSPTCVTVFSHLGTGTKLSEIHSICQ